MRQLRLYFVALFVLGYLSLGASCDKKKLTCEDAMDSFYGNGCAIFADGTQVSEYEAVDGCESDQDDAKDRGCKDEFKDALECLDDVESSYECADCNYPFEKFYSCLYYGG